MNIAFLGGYNSIHTVRWVNEMADRGHNVYLITMHLGKEKLNSNIKIFKLPFNAPIGYYLNVWSLKELLYQIKPDILNTHYASGYGTLARLSGFKPNLLSAWGSDIFDFPYKSSLNFKIIHKNLQEADRIAVTSKIMKQQIEKLYKPYKEIAVTPFGVDCEKFRSMHVEKERNKIVIGTVKKMAPEYGIATLIRAFALVKSRVKKDIELVLVGGGPQEEELKKIAQNLKIDTCVKFIGEVSHCEVPKWLNVFDIYVALSESESFGVAIIEASACGIPVVVSDAGGLAEVVVDGVTGFIVERNNPRIAADKIQMLIENEKLRKTMGEAGRSFVLKNYEWKENADRMELLYKEIIDDYKKCKSFKL
jgi:glycosyltransferase involved in cell wall biosynthesis